MKGRNKTNKYFCSLWMFTILLNTLQLLKRGEWGGGGGAAATLAACVLS